MLLKCVLLFKTIDFQLPPPRSLDPLYGLHEGVDIAGDAERYRNPAYRNPTVTSLLSSRGLRFLPRDSDDGALGDAPAALMTKVAQAAAS